MNRTERQLGQITALADELRGYIKDGDEAKAAFERTQREEGLLAALEKHGHAALEAGHKAEVAREALESMPVDARNDPLGRLPLLRSRLVDQLARGGTHAVHQGDDEITKHARRCRGAALALVLDRITSATDAGTQE